MTALRLVLVAGLALAVFVPSAVPEERKPTPAAKDKPATPQSKLMDEKLKQAQLLLAGLATNDFAKIDKSANELMLISKTAEFLAGAKTKDYEVHTLAFRRSLELIIDKAAKKNLDGATLGYVDMTLTCVRCHQHTREVRNARLPLDVPLVSARK